MLEIEPLIQNDIPFALSLTDYEKWGYTREDFQRLINLSPKGCFVARLRDRPCGIITSVRFDEFAFVGTLIINEYYRGQGLGEELLHYTMNTLKSQGVIYFELDGVFPAVSMYRRLGFRDKYLSLRFIKSAVSDIPSNPELKSPPDNIDDIISFDFEQIGINRGNLVRHYWDDSILTLSTTDNNRTTGYAIVHPIKDNFVKLGPVVAAKSEHANELIREVTDNFKSSNIVLGVPEINQNAIKILRLHGFTYRLPSLRMYLGKRRDYENNIFAIASADKG
jgi:ribosomal protein S18 acetylase RimI-like enzyme